MKLKIGVFNSDMPKIFPSASLRTSQVPVHGVDRSILDRTFSLPITVFDAKPIEEMPRIER